MFGPSLPSRMKKRHVTFSCGVMPGHKYPFEAVAAETRESQVSRFGRAAPRFGNDMLDRKRVGVKPGKAAAILALSLRPLRDCPNQRYRNVGL